MKPLHFVKRFILSLTFQALILPFGYAMEVDEFLRRFQAGQGFEAMPVGETYRCRLIDFTGSDEIPPGEIPFLEIDEMGGFYFNRLAHASDPRNYQINEGVLVGQQALGEDRAQVIQFKRLSGDHLIGIRVLVGVHSASTPVGFLGGAGSPTLSRRVVTGFVCRRRVFGFQGNH